jgi:hypothetical protein
MNLLVKIVIAHLSGQVDRLMELRVRDARPNVYETVR